MHENGIAGKEDCIRYYKQKHYSANLSLSKACPISHRQMKAGSNLGYYVQGASSVASLGSRLYWNLLICFVRSSTFSDDTTEDWYVKTGKKKGNILLSEHVGFLLCPDLGCGSCNSMLSLFVDCSVP
jgi:hypothetical protein